MSAGPQTTKSADENSSRYLTPGLLGDVAAAYDAVRANSGEVIGNADVRAHLVGRRNVRAPRSAASPFESRRSHVTPSAVAR